VTVAPPHVTTAGDREKAIPWEKLFVDLGMRDAEEAARAGVEPGTPAVLDAGMGRMGANAFQARNLDDRAGCAALLALIERLQGVEPKAELVFNFASAEEVGLRGAGPAAFSLKPDLALVVECTMGDTPGLEPRCQPARMGRGPAVTVADGRMIAPLRIVKSLEDAARRAGAPCQRKLPGIGGTDAGAIHTSRGGVPTGVVSIPARYIHSPVSLLYLDDLAATVDLVAAWLDRVDELL
jgi:endoglucanase